MNGELGRIFGRRQ